MQLSCLVGTIFILCWGSSSLGIPVSISEDGGYSIVIAIHKNVPEDVELISTIKTLFGNASEFLYNATRRQVYFKEITISVPPTWTSKPEYTSCIQDNFEGSHYRVSEEYDSEPSTDQSEGCGRQGQFVRLSPNYLSNLETTVEDFGIPERRIVHEWAHFRYGVFDEKWDPSSSSSFKPYYRSKGKLLPSVCSASLAEAGELSKADGDVCTPKDEDDTQCTFQISNHYVTSRASIMFSTSIDKVDSFCDDSEELKHNPEALTMHNRLCNRESTWTVISRHQDFKKLQRFAFVDTVPQFRVVRATGEKGRSVLLLDISGSMRGLPIQMLHESATQMVLQKAPENSSLGIVAFGTNPTMLKQMTLVNKSSRQDLAAHLPKQANGGGTGIGKGLLTSLKVLKGPQGTGALEGGVIVLITDGEETDEPYVKDVIPGLVDARVVVHVIAYGDKASVLMEKLAGETGGRVSVFANIHSVKADTDELVTKIAEAVTLHSDVELEPVKVVSGNIRLEEKELVVPVILDEELGRNTVFKFSSPDLTGVEVKLSIPSKVILDWQSKEYRKNNNKVITFTFAEAETGLYNVTLLSAGRTDASVHLTLDSEAKDPKKQPIRVKTWIGDTEVVFPERPSVYAQIKKGEKPVLNANVTADIIGPDSTDIVVLLDNGTPPDILKDDGCYSGYVIKINGNHRYQVTAHVKNTKKSRLKKRTKNIRIGTRRRREANEETKENISEEELLEEDEEDEVLVFERVADAGVFRVSGWTPELKDQLAPAAVSDLRVLNVSGDEVTLAWTSPGDDLTVGNATSIDLRGSPSFDAIYHNFYEQGILVDNLTNSSLSPFPAGETQTVILLIPEELRQLPRQENDTSDYEISDTFYFALKAADEENNIADLSNIVYATFHKDIISTEAEDEQTSTEDDRGTNETMILMAENEENRDDNGVNAVTVIGAILAVLLAVAIVLALIYCVIKKSGTYTVVTMSESV